MITSPWCAGMKEYNLEIKLPSQCKCDNPNANIFGTVYGSRISLKITCMRCGATLQSFSGVLQEHADPELVDRALPNSELEVVIPARAGSS